MTRALPLLLLLTGCAASTPGNAPTLPPGGLAPESGVDIPLGDLLALKRQSDASEGHSPGVGMSGYSTSPVSIAPAPNGQPVILPVEPTVRSGEWITFEVRWPGHSMAGLTWFWTAEGGAYPPTEAGQEFTVRWAVAGRHRVACLRGDGGEPAIAYVTVTE